METTTQIYLQITMEGGTVIDGESVAGGYEGRIDIDSFTFNAKAKKESLKDIEKGVKANIDFKTISFSKVFDRATLHLASVMQGTGGAKRKKFTEAVISIDQQYVSGERVGKHRNEIVIFTMYDGYIAQVKLRNTEAGAGASIKDDVELSFHNFDFTYYAEDRNAKGKLDDPSNWRPLPFFYQTEREVQE